MIVYNFKMAQNSLMDNVYDDGDGSFAFESDPGLMGPYYGQTNPAVANNFTAQKNFQMGNQKPVIVQNPVVNGGGSKPFARKMISSKLISQSNSEMAKTETTEEPRVVEPPKLEPFVLKQPVNPQPFIPQNVVPQPFIPEPFIPPAADPPVELPKPVVQKQEQSEPINVFVPSPEPKPQEIDFRSKYDSIEAGFASAMDRSMANLKRIFANEFASIVRQPSSPVPAFDVDEFSDSLSAEVSEIIQAPLQSIDIGVQNVSRKVASVIDEHTKPVSANLAEVDSRNAVAADHHIAELRQLQDELESLRSVFKKSTDGIVQELEKERLNASTIRDKEQAKYRQLEQRMRAIKLKQVELESKSNHQNVEREGIERLSKQLEQKRRVWEEESQSNMYEDGGSLRQRILQELNDLRNDLANESFESLTRAVDDGLASIKEEGDGLRNELMELELANRWMMTRTKEGVQMSRSPVSARRSTSGSVLTEAQNTLNRLRKQREASMRDLSYLQLR